MNMSKITYLLKGCSHFKSGMDNGHATFKRLTTLNYVYSPFNGNIYVQEHYAI